MSSVLSPNNNYTKSRTADIDFAMIAAKVTSVPKLTISRKQNACNKAVVHS